MDNVETWDVVVPPEASSENQRFTETCDPMDTSVKFVVFVVDSNGFGTIDSGHGTLETAKVWQEYITKHGLVPTGTVLVEVISL
mgnify:CR=1 FL=1